jgi:hypothetical protein
MKKISLAVLFLTVLLLFGVLLRAANNTKRTFTIEKAKGAEPIVEIKKDMELVPVVILL